MALVILSITLLIMVPVAGAVDNTTVFGIVVDANNEPIKGAKVSCDSQETLTATNGSFSLQVFYDQDTITVSADGFHETTVTVDAADLGRIMLEPVSQGTSLALIALILACGAGIFALQIYMTRRR